METAQFIASYFCPKYHSLTWNKVYITVCGICGPVHSTMSRFGCNVCNQNYCTKCILPPIKGDFCGAGHPMKYLPSLPYHSCDVCRKSVKAGAYRCGQCDYDVCEDCHLVKED